MLFHVLTDYLLKIRTDNKVDVENKIMHVQEYPSGVFMGRDTFNS